MYEVDCTMGELFFNSWGSGKCGTHCFTFTFNAMSLSVPASLYYVVRHPLFIAGIIVLILALLIVIFVCCYTTQWKKKKEIELLVKSFAKWIITALSNELISGISIVDSLPIRAHFQSSPAAAPEAGENSFSEAFSIARFPSDFLCVCHFASVMQFGNSAAIIKPSEWIVELIAH